MFGLSIIKTSKLERMKWDIDFHAGDALRHHSTVADWQIKVAEFKSTIASLEAGHAALRTQLTDTAAARDRNYREADFFVKLSAKATKFAAILIGYFERIAIVDIELDEISLVRQSNPKMAPTARIALNKRYIEAYASLHQIVLESTKDIEAYRRADATLAATLKVSDVKKVDNVDSDI